MKNLIKKAKYVLSGDDGASNLEIIVWFSVVLVIATALWLFRDAVVGFIGNAKDKVAGLRVG